MLKAYALALSLLLAGSAVIADPAPGEGRGSGRGGDRGASFRMPQIAAPGVSAARCAYRKPIRLDGTPPSVSKLCVQNGKVLVNGGHITGFVLSDIIARNWGPILRGMTMPDVKVVRVSATDARADPTLGLGIVNISNGIGHAVFSDLTWIGDPNAPAINSNDAWAAIALKGKHPGDVGTFEIRNFDFQNLRMAPGKNYLNVDGISTEAGYSGTITNGRVLNASDACLDIKGNVHVDNVYVAGCREGLKIWQSQKHGLIQLGTNAYVGIIGKGRAGQPRRIDIDVLIVTGDPKIPLFRAEEGPVDLHIGRLVAKPSQVLKAEGSYSGSQVIIGQRVNS